MEGREITTKINTGNTEEAEKIIETRRDKIEEEANKNQEVVNTEELRNDKIGKAVLKMKLNKAAGLDAIQIEAWSRGYGGEEMKRELEKLLRRI